MNPFAIINDSSKKIGAIIFDKNLENHEYLGVHPMDNGATIELKRSDFYTFIQSIDRKLDTLVLEDALLENNVKVEKKIDKKVDKKPAATADEEEGTKLKLKYKKEEDFSKWYRI